MFEVLQVRGFDFSRTQINWQSKILNTFQFKVILNKLFNEQKYIQIEFHDKIDSTNYQNK